jgi:mRNA deadenylase 3'-5' endonuclease subunit Ccr4
MDPAEWVLPDDGDRFQPLKYVFNQISTMDNVQEVCYFNNTQSSQNFNEYFVLNTTIFLFTYMLQ